MINYANGGLPLNDYATVADLHNWLDADEPVDSLRLIRHAQRLVDSAITSAMYKQDANGNPTDAGVLAALRDATCAQVEDWIINGDETSSLDKLGSLNMDGVAFTRSGGARKFRLCDRAIDILKAAKLVPGTVIVG